MARQEILFAEAIAGIKRALLRKDEDNDMDSMGEPVSNRGNKLKRKAAFTQQGRLNNTENYKRRVTFHGYSRAVISRNPPRLDPDGDAVDDDDESDPDLTPAEDDPYSEVKLQDILMPLTHPSQLRNHPSLSLPYTSRAIDQLIQNAQEMLSKEQVALWRVKQMASEIRGDQTWVPCGALETEHDLLLFNQGVPGTTAPPSVAGTLPDTTSNIDFGDRVDQTQPTAGTEATRLDAENEPKAETTRTADTMDVTRHELDRPETAEERPDSSNAADPGASTKVEEADASHPEEPTDTSMTGNAESVTKQPTATHDDSDITNNTTTIPISQEDDAPAAHQMTTRSARAQAFPPASPDSPNLTTSPSTPQVHPFFLAPEGAMPSRSYGLPPMEADDTRRLLYAYCQRQEEVVRGVQRLYHGLLRAKRMRDTVWEWCNAEGHIGEMSDGEDWVDEGAWGLAEGELKKGEDEIEEGDAEVVVGGRGAGVAAGGGKKTRGRRGAGG